MTEQKPNTAPFRRRSDTETAALLRVAAVQLPRLDPEDRASLRKYVERDMEIINGL